MRLSRGDCVFRDGLGGDIKQGVWRVVILEYVRIFGLPYSCTAMLLSLCMGFPHYGCVIAFVACFIYAFEISRSRKR